MSLTPVETRDNDHEYTSDVKVGVWALQLIKSDTTDIGLVRSTFVLLLIFFLLLVTHALIKLLPK